VRRDVSSQYGGMDETCPVSTGGGTRRVQSVRGEGGTASPAACAAQRGRCPKSASKSPAESHSSLPAPRPAPPPQRPRPRPRARRARAGARAHHSARSPTASHSAAAREACSFADRSISTARTATPHSPPPVPPSAADVGVEGSLSPPSSCEPSAESPTGLGAAAPAAVSADASSSLLSAAGLRPRPAVSPAGSARRRGGAGRGGAGPAAGRLGGGGNGSKGGGGNGSKGGGGCKMEGAGRAELEVAVRPERRGERRAVQQQQQQPLAARLRRNLHRRKRPASPASQRKRRRARVQQRFGRRPVPRLHRRHQLLLRLPARAPRAAGARLYGAPSSLAREPAPALLGLRLDPLQSRR